MWSSSFLSYLKKELRKELEECQLRNYETEKASSAKALVVWETKIGLLRSG